MRDSILRGHEGTIFPKSTVLAVTALVRAGAWGTCTQKIGRVERRTLCGIASFAEMAGEVELVQDTALTQFLEASCSREGAHELSFE